MALYTKFPDAVTINWWNGFPQWSQQQGSPGLPSGQSNGYPSVPPPAAHPEHAYEGPITLNDEELKAMKRLQCSHDMKDYYGLKDAFKFCVHCDYKEPLE